MNRADETLATGTLTNWAGTTRVEATAAGVRAVQLPSWHAGPPSTGLVEAPVLCVEEGGSQAAVAHLRQALTELAEYFAGERRAFGVTLDLAWGTPFFRSVWAAVAAVPYGETRSYGEIARTLEAAQASRAVGAANGANPVAPFVPCHRIVGTDGRLTGYGPGLPLKRRLLEMEDVLPTSQGDYAAWLARRLAARGGHPFVLGMRSAGVFCLPQCPLASGRALLPTRIFDDVAAALAAGYAPCPRCQPADVATTGAAPARVGAASRARER